KNTYNTRDSLVVTDPTTSLALTGLSMGERTGSRVFQWVWSYVVDWRKIGAQVEVCPQDILMARGIFDGLPSYP
ncbi:hypothetical protein NEUTE1DRAFT_43809, partial [Neurospora tetrasperma FGSC 2508]